MMMTPEFSEMMMLMMMGNLDFGFPSWWEWILGTSLARTLPSSQTKCVRSGARAHPAKPGEFCSLEPPPQKLSSSSKILLLLLRSHNVFGFRLLKQTDVSRVVSISPLVPFMGGSWCKVSRPRDKLPMHEQDVAHVWYDNCFFLPFLPSVNNEPNLYL